MKKIAIIGAMREEIAPLLAKLPQHRVQNIAGNDYYIAAHPAHEGCQIIIAYSKIGKIHAALTCATMILHFGAECVIFSGVAGGLQGDLKIGDIILATALCQYDVDISAFGHPLGFIPESAVMIKTSESLNAIAKAVAKNRQIALKEGVIASGDSFICDAAKKEWIVEHFGAAAVEMEGASIAVVASLAGVPFCVIRAISDSANEEASVNFDEFLADSATKSADFCLDFALAVVEAAAKKG